MSIQAVEESRVGHEADGLSNFLAWEHASRDTIDVKRIYIDIAGDLTAGVLLSQIVFWFLPAKDGQSRLKVIRDGREWLVKRRKEWWDEIRITPRQYDRAIKALVDKDLVELEHHSFKGYNYSCFIRLKIQKLAEQVAYLIHQSVIQTMPSDSPKPTSYHIDNNIDYSAQPPKPRKGQTRPIYGRSLSSGEEGMFLPLRKPLA